jgi:hypothetical protein
MSFTFSIMIKNWTTDTNGDKLPVCEISSSTEITNALQDHDAYSAEELLVCKKDEQHITSFVFWRASRVHCNIGDITVSMHNLEDRVGILLYSKTTKFSVGSAIVMHEKGAWHSFVVLENVQSIQVK